ncbi:ATP-binding protein [Methanolobus sp. ZRKC3]|uniref:ATP-binding protein n=1 Tax=Methanolobus sp. ZRKC3 TaxID=3125786 RepID=UPI00324FD8ED
MYLRLEDFSFPGSLNDVLNIEKLFQPFKQIDSFYTRNYDGTGLGLALVKQLVEMHGGNITVESEIGKGSKFIFSFPDCTR